MRLLDSHAHLAEEAFDEDRAEVLQRAAVAGVEAVVVIGYEVESSLRAIEVVRGGTGGTGVESGGPPLLAATAGFAPHNVADATPAALERTRELLREPEVVAVGEIGLDYHYDMPREEQRELFREQLGWARETRMPVVVHSRDAEEDVVTGLRDVGIERGVIHCFTESARMAQQVLELGLYVSFSGIVTFPSAGELRRVARSVPLARTLIETDSPYLAPPPHRGKRNEPAFVAEVARALAEVHGVDVAEVAERTADNAVDLFGLPPAGTDGSVLAADDR